MALHSGRRSPRRVETGPCRNEPSSHGRGCRRVFRWGGGRRNDLVSRWRYENLRLRTHGSQSVRVLPALHKALMSVPASLISWTGYRRSKGWRSRRRSTSLVFDEPKQQIRHRGCPNSVDSFRNLLFRSASSRHHMNPSPSRRGSFSQGGIVCFCAKLWSQQF